MTSEANPQAAPKPSPELLRFEKVQAGYGRRRILSDLDFSLSSGDYVAFVGSNGSGKTTLLRTLLGLLRPDLMQKPDAET